LAIVSSSEVTLAVVSALIATNSTCSAAFNLASSAAAIVDGLGSDAVLDTILLYAPRIGRARDFGDDQ